MSNNNIQYGELDRRGRTKGANQLTFPGQEIPLRPAYRQQPAVVSGLDHISGYKDNIEYWIRTMVRDPEKTARLLDLLERRWFEDGSSGEGTGTRLAGGDDVELEAVDGQRELGEDSYSDRTSPDNLNDVSMSNLTTESSQHKGKNAFSPLEFAANRRAIECLLLDDASLPFDSDTITPAPLENRAKQDDTYDDSPTGYTEQEEEAGSGFPKVGAWSSTADDKGVVSGGREEAKGSAETRVSAARRWRSWTATSKIMADSLKSLPLLALSVTISLCFHALLVAEIFKDLLRLHIAGFASQEVRSINT